MRFLRERLAQAGCTVEPEPGRVPFVHVRHCDQSVAGGFVPTEGVVVCHNHLTCREEVEHALAHELIHAYDHWCVAIALLPEMHAERNALTPT